MVMGRFAEEGNKIDRYRNKPAVYATQAGASRSNKVNRNTAMKNIKRRNVAEGTNQ